MIPRIRPCLATRFSSSWNIKLRLAQSFIIIPRNCQHSSIHSYSLYTRHIRFYTLTACGQKLLSGPDRNWFTINERRMPGVYSYSRIFVHIFFPKTIWCYLFDSMFNIGWAHLGAISLRSSPLPAINTYYSRLSYNFLETILSYQWACHSQSSFSHCQSLPTEYNCRALQISNFQ